jgi:glycosyltransferase involved in cell wall biosynthesis
MRILVIWESAVVSGPGKNLLQFARTVQPDLEMEIALFQRPGQSTGFLEAARAAGIPVHIVPERGRFDRSVIPALRELARSRRPDIIQTHAIKGHFLVPWAGLNHAPWVAFQHGYTATDWRNRVYNLADRWSLPRADRLVVVSEALRDLMVSRGVPGDRLHVVHNAIDPAWASAARAPEATAALAARWDLPAGRPVILLAARLSAEKDHALLLRAVALIPAERRPLILLAGDGPERSSLEALAANLGLTGDLRITGWVPSAEPFYGLADLAVLCSRSEGSPNALLEAMGAGLPIVATRVGGIPEIVRHEDSALLVPSGDAAALAAAIRRLLEDPALAQRLAAGARRDAHARFSPQARAAAIRRVYEAASLSAR